MKTAMILAAGRGERLRPLTDTTPKALCEVHGIPLIVHHVRKLANAGFERIIVNHAWLGGQIRRTLGDGRQWHIDIIYSPEPPGGLETGGGILQALPMLGEQPFLTVNADIYTHFDFSQLALSAQSLAKIVLIKTPVSEIHSDFGMNEKKLIINDHRAYTFAGIACYNPVVFSNCRIGRYSVTPILRALADQQKMEGEVYQGMWIDTGSPERLALANRL